jgi:predicted DNA-binding transcriptional regulator AlpA
MATEATVAVVRAALRSDPTISEIRRRLILRELEEGEWISAPAAARLLEISRRSFWRWMAEGRFGRVARRGSGRGLRFARGPIETAVEGGRVL